MIWNHPAALWGLLLVAGPVLVHLLVRRHATRVVFPAMRFVPGVRAAAVRLRAPSDTALLILRTAIVATVVLATAGPLLITAGRQRAWDSRVALAIVVDTSASVAADTAAQEADRAALGTFASQRFASSDLREGLSRATEWLETAPAPRRSIAIISDFQRGSIGGADVAGVPASTGINIFRVGPPRASAATGSIDGWRGARWDRALTLDPVSTQVTWTRRGDAARTGLTVLAGDADQAAAERAAEAARSFGVPASDPERRVGVAFSGAPVSADALPRTPWIASAAMALHGSALLAETGAQVTVGERDGGMTVKTTLPATSAFAPAVIRAVMLAAAPPAIDREAEPSMMDAETMRQLVRQGTPLPGVKPPADESDARWLWGLALGLLVLETAVRRRGAVKREAEARADAA